jgi:hypothetical protein
MMTKSPKKPSGNGDAMLANEVRESGAKDAQDGAEPQMVLVPKTKAAALREMVIRPGGASLQSLMAATGWQAHTVRAALSGLRKSGIDLIRTASAGGPVYAMATASTEMPVGAVVGVKVEHGPRKKVQQATAVNPEASNDRDNPPPPLSTADAAAAAPIAAMEAATDVAATPAVAS